MSVLPTPSQELWLQVELLSVGSDLLQLNAEQSTFEPLVAQSTEVPLAGGSPFVQHSTLPLPCDHGTPDSQAQSVAPGFVDTIHRFVLRRDLAKELNEELTGYALERETLADKALFEWSAQEENAALHGAEWVDAWLRDGAKDKYDSGVRRTNVGGYQSQMDIFDGQQGEDGRGEQVTWGCRQLHRICSEAMEALVGYENGASQGRATQRTGKMHSASAWVNVNRGTAFNTMHRHDVGWWSAVYFVASGGSGGGNPTCDGWEDDKVEKGNGIARHLVLRGGTQPQVQLIDEVEDHAKEATEMGTSMGTRKGWLGVTDAPVGPASHCYLAVPPLPGTLWFFPGSVPHCVLGTEECVSDPLDRSGELDSSTDNPDEEARISVAMNFTDAKAPPPHRPHHLLSSML